MNAKQLIESIYTDNEFVRATIGAGYRQDRKAFKADAQSVNDVKQRMRLLREDSAEDALEAFEDEVNTWISDEFSMKYDSAVYVWGSPEDKDKLYRLHQQGAEFCSYSWDGCTECSLKLKMGECKKLLANGWRPVCYEDNGDVHEIVFTRPAARCQQEDKAEDALRALDNDRVRVYGEDAGPPYRLDFDMPEDQDTASMNRIAQSFNLGFIAGPPRIVGDVGSLAEVKDVAEACFRNDDLPIIMLSKLGKGTRVDFEWWPQFM